MTMDFKYERINNTDNYAMEGENLTNNTEHISSSSTNSIKPPVDRYNFVTITFHLLGISVLLPFTFFVTANDYWMYKFRNVSETFPSTDPKYKTEIQTMFTAYLALADNVTGFIISILNMYFIKRRYCDDSLSVWGGSKGELCEFREDLNSLGLTSREDP